MAKTPLKNQAIVASKPVRISKITGKPVQKRNYTNPTGRPTKYKPEYCQAIIDYFDIPAINESGQANTPPYVLNFCLCIGIDTTTLPEWIKKYPEFSLAYNIAKQKQKQLIINNALTGGYNASFAWRAMMNMHGWRDKQEHTGEDGKELFPVLTEKERAILAGINEK